jgi:hypothetical protein
MQQKAGSTQKQCTGNALQKQGAALNARIASQPPANRHIKTMQLPVQVAGPKGRDKQPADM